MYARCARMCQERQIWKNDIRVNYVLYTIMVYKMIFTMSPSARTRPIPSIIKFTTDTTFDPDPRLRLNISSLS